MIKHTIAVPEAKIAEANAAMITFTGNEADGETFEAAHHQDNEGNLYAVCSGLFESQPITIDGMLVSTEDNALDAVAAMGLVPRGVTLT